MAAARGGSGSSRCRSLPAAGTLTELGAVGVEPDQVAVTVVQALGLLPLAHAHGVVDNLEGFRIEAE